MNALILIVFINSLWSLQSGLLELVPKGIVGVVLWRTWSSQHRSSAFQQISTYQPSLLLFLLYKTCWVAVTVKPFAVWQMDQTPELLVACLWVPMDLLVHSLSSCLFWEFEKLLKQPIRLMRSQHTVGEWVKFSIFSKHIKHEQT